MKRSKFIVIAAPSGSGKTTIVNKLLNEKNLGLSFSISATSREPRKNEKDGENYFFISKEEFLRRVNNCLLYTSPSPRDRTRSRMPSSA